MPVLADEGVPVDLAPGEPGQPHHRAEAGQRGVSVPSARWPGEQQGRVGLPDQRRQLAGSGDEGGAVGPPPRRACRPPPPAAADLRRPQVGQRRRLRSVCPISARSRSHRPGESARNCGQPLGVRVDPAHHRERRGHHQPAGLPAGKLRARDLLERREACPGPGRKARRTGATRCRSAPRATSTRSRSRRSARRSARSRGSRARSAGTSSVT